ncbi:hypothetical protein C9374_012278 [Naegleria lovaniensis]|uniref:Ubiquitin-activating enzyme E1 C-terminal domain-containing protein n=1 Tax=Naegleria lovaniensis TaxID=51637 RepID=A0AA88GET0_NAELO|nr:uncharacterized protein C9374_012278 [Naegleria lovaniensis]KAG2373289.1 hypothetical protein C9374_012278 [Naegleria lovaniensis]
MINHHQQVINTDEWKPFASSLIQFFGSDGVDRMKQQTILIHHLLQHSCGDVLIGLEIAKNIVLSFGGSDHDITLLVEIANTNFFRNYGKGLQEIFQAFSFLLEDDDEILFTFQEDNYDKSQNRHLQEIQHIYERFFASKGGNVRVIVEFCDQIEKSRLQNDSFLSQFTIISVNNYNMLDLIAVNEKCRSHNIKMIAAETRGLVGSVFSDFGNSFVVKDLPHPNSVLYDYFYVTDISPTNPATITLRGGSLQGQTTNLKGGDVINLQRIESIPEIEGSYFTCLDVNYLYDNNLCVTIDLDATMLPPFDPVSAGYVIRVCKETITQHKPLKEILANASLESSLLHVENQKLLHASIESIGKFYKQFHRFPHSHDDFKELMSLVNQSNGDSQSISKTDEDIVTILAATYSSQLAIISALIGGVASMEIQKAASSYYGPIPNQLFYFDAFDCLHKDQKVKLVNNYYDTTDHMVHASMYDAQELIFGKHVHEKIENSKHLLYDMGSMGCEFLKNYTMMGVGNGIQGSFLVSDDKQVTLKHLETHALFRKKHIGQTKSEASTQVIQKLKHSITNSSTRSFITSMKESSIDESSEFLVDLITDSFNGNSRVDFKEICNRDKISLIKTICNNGVLYDLQVVVPYVTSLYENLVGDKPYYKTGLPTLPIQCMDWAKTVVDQTFGYYVDQALNYVQDPNAFSTTSALEHVYNVLLRDRSTKFLDCVKWARLQFEILFKTSIQSIMERYGYDMISNGTRFWSVTKRFPRVLNFDIYNANHVEVVSLLSKFQAQRYGINIPEEFDLLTCLKEISGDSSTIARNDLMDDDTDYAQLLQQSTIPHDMELHPFHNYEDEDYLKLIYLTTILRCENFRIIEPSMLITWHTTLESTPIVLSLSSIISALGCLEFYKIIQGFQDSYNNASVHVANSQKMFTQTAPKKPTILTSFPTRTFWDTIDIDENNEITLKDLLDIMKDRYNLEISMCSSGRSMLFSFFLKPQRRSNDLAKTISQLVFEKSKTPVSSKYILIDMCCNDLITQEEFDDVPSIRYRCYQDQPRRTHN